MKEKCACGRSVIIFSYERCGYLPTGEPLGRCCMASGITAKKPTQEEPKMPVPQEPNPVKVEPTPEITLEPRKALTPVERWFTECGFQPTSRNLFSVPALRLYTAYKNWLATHLPDEKTPSITKFGLLMNKLCRKYRKPSGQFYLVQREP